MSDGPNGNGLDPDTERWAEQAKKFDREQELENRLDFAMSELADIRRSTDVKLTRLVELGEALALKVDAMNAVLERFLVLSNENDKRITALEKRHTARRK